VLSGNNETKIVEVNEYVDSDFTESDYTEVTNACWEVCRQLKFRSDDSFLNDIVGYRLVATHSLHQKEFAGITRKDVPSKTSFYIKELLSKGNGEKNINNKKLYCPLVTNVDKENEAPTYTPINMEIVTQTIVQPPTTTTTSQKRMSCCACKITSTSQSDNPRTYSKVPISTVVITEKSSDERRIKYYSQNFRRKIFLQRLGLSTTMKKKYLTYCNLHKLQAETFSVPYRNKDGLKRTNTCKLIVPVDIYATKLAPTRANKMLVHSPPPIQPRQINYETTDSPVEDEVSILGVESTSDSETDTDTEVDSKVNVKHMKYRPCAFHKCTSKWCRGMTRIPALPIKVPKQYHSHNFERLKCRSKYVLPQECLKRIGIISNININSSSFDNKDYRICSKHETETIHKVVEFTDLQNRKKTAVVPMIVPISYDNIKSTCLVVGSIRRESNNSRWRDKIETTNGYR
jgi:hypothetical protein